MNNYQEWGDPPIVPKDTDTTKPVDEHIKPGFMTANTIQDI